MKNILGCVFAAAVSLVVTGCGVESEAPSMSREAALQEAFRHANFQATYRMLESRGDVLAPSAAIVEEEAGALVLRIPVTGESKTELVFQRNGQDVPVVSVRREVPEEEDVSAAAACGTYLSANSCSFGPWDSGADCDGGAPLYKYDKYTRRYYSNGRNISYETTWYDCRWMAQPSDCNNTCG